MIHPVIHRLIAAACVCHILVACATSAAAQPLTWGAGGVGGSGTWNTTNANWYNGSAAVTWPSGGNAIFTGASGGAVNISGFGVTASSLTFNSSGYVIQGGILESSASGLTITANVAATISSSLEASGTSGSSLVKNGAAQLTLAGINFLDTLQVNQGELIASGSSSLFFSDVTLANTPGVTVTLAQSSTIADMGSLSGGGISGGIVQPNNQGRTVTLNVFDTGSFAGTLRDNGAGILGLNVIGSQTLTNANTYSGPTTANGTLTLAGNGTVKNSAISATFGKLVIDNSGSAVADRISDTLPFALKQGSFQLQGNSTTPVNESVGVLSIAGGSSVSITQAGSAATQLTFAGLHRDDHATLSVNGQGVGIPGLANGPTGIIAPYVTAGNDWAIVGGDGRLTALSTYASDINSGSAGDHVKINGGGTTTLAVDTTRASLNLQDSTPATTQVLDLAGHNLGLSSGGVLSSGSGNNSISNGSLFTTSQEMVVTANNNLTISASIVENAGATTLTKSGPGTLTLTGNNTYAGNTAIESGTLVVSSDVNLGTGPAIELVAGALKAGASFTSTKGFAHVAIAGGAVDTAGYNLTFSGAVQGGFTKLGDGTLTLTTAPSAATILSVNQGILELPSGSPGIVNLAGATLEASGTLSLLRDSTQIGPAVLDLGGTAATHLTTNTFEPSLNGPLQIDFGIGSAASDFWTIGSSTSFSVQFEFANLGGAHTGVSYQLMSFSRFTAPATNLFSFAPDMAAKGWAGNFTTTTSGAFVTFTAVPVPEPQTTALLLLQGMALVFAARRLFGRRNV